MTPILCMLVMWQPAPQPPALPSDVRGVAITWIDSSSSWFSVTLKREGEDWEDVLPLITDAECDCFFAALPRSGLDFEVVLSRNGRPQIQVPGADDLILDSTGILDEVLVNNFGLHQVF